MLDVHPPHHAAHSWRDFFTHIATIVVGLLIALGLEQTVEAVHRHRERAQLLEDLHQEAEGRVRDIASNDRAILVLGTWLQDSLRTALAAAPDKGYVTFTLPGMPATDGQPKPETAVWSAAKSSGAVNVLSRKEVEAWERLDYFAQQAQGYFETSQVALRSIQAVADHLGAVFEPQASVRVTVAGRDELTRATGVAIESIGALHHENQETISASKTVLHED